MNRSYIVASVTSLWLAHHSIRPIYWDADCTAHSIAMLLTTRWWAVYRRGRAGGVCDVYSIRRRCQESTTTSRTSQRSLRRLSATGWRAIVSGAAWRIRLGRHRSINDSFCRVCQKSIDFKSDLISPVFLPNDQPNDSSSSLLDEWTTLTAAFERNKMLQKVLSVVYCFMH